MITELEIWRSAAAMIMRYSTEAGLESAKRADELLAAGDVDGSATWPRIMTAVGLLQAGKPEATRVN